MRHNRITGKAGIGNPNAVIHRAPLHLLANSEHGQSGPWPVPKRPVVHLERRRRQLLKRELRRASR